MKHQLAIWIFYFLGQLMHVLKRSDMSTGPQVGVFSGFGVYLKKNARGLLIRTFLETCFFWLWLQKPDFLNIVMARLGVTIGFDVPAIPPIAGLLGFAMDSMLDWVGERVNWFTAPKLPDATDNKADSAAGGKQ